MTSALVWFRRDLRLQDHAALYQALRHHSRVWCVFVFDEDILEPLRRQGLLVDRRVEFILGAVAELDQALAERGAALLLRRGRAREEIPRLARELGVDAVFANRDYEPFAVDRDGAVASALGEGGVGFLDFKDQVIFDRDEVLTREGRPYGVFTPYKNAWLRQLDDFQLTPYPVERYLDRLAPSQRRPLPSQADLGFAPSNLSSLKIPLGMSGAQALLRDFAARIDDYDRKRDYPALKGPSYLSAHLRFGTLSIRQVAAYAHGRARLRNSAGAATWLGELIWRDFYHAILWHHPRVADGAFKPEFDRIAWDEAPQLLAAWEQGRTGYPLVDAAQRQLLQTGYMHNRLRMVSASFLTKDLGISWRAGEAHFARHLLDFDLAANNGGWQWAASTGCDAQPWFRIFNPVTQSEKFDPKGAFIRRYVPELAAVPDRHIHAPWRMDAEQQRAAGVVLGRDYPLPLVDHAAARERTLARFGRLGESGGPLRADQP